MDSFALLSAARSSRVDWQGHPGYTVRKLRLTICRTIGFSKVRCCSWPCGSLLSLWCSILPRWGCVSPSPSVCARSSARLLRCSTIAWKGHRSRVENAQQHLRALSGPSAFQSALEEGSRQVTFFCWKSMTVCFRLACKASISLRSHHAANSADLPGCIGPPIGKRIGSLDLPELIHGKALCLFFRLQLRIAALGPGPDVVGPTTLLPRGWTPASPLRWSHGLIQQRRLACCGWLRKLHGLLQRAPCVRSSLRSPSRHVGICLRWHTNGRMWNRNGESFMQGGLPLRHLVFPSRCYRWAIFALQGSLEPGHLQASVRKETSTNQTKDNQG